LLGTDATVEPLKPVLIARTGGNPLFLEESVRTLIETNILTGERGAHRLACPLPAGSALLGPGGF
jgi:predicted ATPase